MLRHRAQSAATPERVWTLLGDPGRWSSWAPHVRGLDRLGPGDLRPGRLLLVRLGGLLPVPARVTAVGPGHRWAWRVGPTRIEHRVEPHASGAEVVMEVHAPVPLEAAARLSYGPVIGLMCRRLARAAEREAQAAQREAQAARAATSRSAHG